MKIIRLCSFIFLICLISVSFLASSWASGPWPRHKGTRCWNVYRGDGSLAGVRTLRITNMGENHYLCNGRFMRTDGGVSSVIGSAEMNREMGKDSILMTLVSTRGDTVDFMSTGHIYVILDAATLNGTEQKIVHETFDTGVESGYGSGTVTFVSCQ
ncbi:MAG TPA: hypothetical protein VJ440_07975 [Candidatus Brocadiaceae bacterium]|nr:hypothetical protein [Candidatus Brocadiaceae bacterium]